MRLLPAADAEGGNSCVVFRPCCPPIGLADWVFGAPKLRRSAKPTVRHSSVPQSADTVIGAARLRRSANPGSVSPSVRQSASVLLAAVPYVEYRWQGAGFFPFLSRGEYAFAFSI